MNLKNLVEGIEILRKHFDNPDGYHLGAEHDQVYIYATDKPLDAENVTALRSLGWFQPDTSEDDYAPEESWSAFT